LGQILHGSAKTTHAVRAAIQRSKASIQELASRYDLNPKTVMKWRKRAFLYDAPMGPKVPRSTVLSAEEEALAVAFRKHTLLPLDDSGPAHFGTTQLGRVLINAQIAAPLLWVIHIGCPKNCTHCHHRSGA